MNFVHFADCQLPYFPLFVETSNFFMAPYNSTGEFSCTNNGSLYHSNGTLLTTLLTTCLPNAEWSGINEIGCWESNNLMQ